MKRFVVTFLLFSFTIVYAEVTVAVAANVSYAMQPLLQRFHHLYPTIKVNVILGSSGKLVAQIIHGAPYDLFLSADMQYPEILYHKGLTLGEPVMYAQGALALFSSKSYNYQKGLAVLEDKKIEKIAIANPQTAPYGVASVEALEHAHLYYRLQPKFVYGESISQTVIYATRVADIGIVAKSSLYAPQMAKYKEKVHWIEINASLYTPIEQGMVQLKQSQEKSEVKIFYDFLLGKEAKMILNAYGYQT